MNNGFFASTAFITEMSLLVTFILGIAGLWIKTGTGTKKVTLKLNEIDTVNKKEHKIIQEQLTLNAEITKGYSQKKDTYMKLANIKAEAIRWSPKELNNFLVLKANAMVKFFMDIEEREFSKVDIDVINAELEVAINKLKIEANKLINNEFVDYYFNKYHDANIEKYLNDLTTYKRGKINNMNEAFLTRSVVFYRHSLESLLNLWNQYKQEDK